jgi:hypothetical protein
VAVFNENSFPLVVSSKDINLYEFDEVRVYDGSMKYGEPTIELVVFEDIPNPHYMTQMTTYQRHIKKYRKAFNQYKEELQNWEDVANHDLEDWTTAIELDLEEEEI